MGGEPSQTSRGNWHFPEFYEELTPVQTVNGECRVNLARECLQPAGKVGRLTVD
jgi:hypothetical protein